MGLARCLLYMAALGAATFPLGRLFKRLNFDWDRPPFAEWRWERGGEAYLRLGVRRWKDRAPDVSRVFPNIVPRKALIGRFGPELVRDMLSETCVAEAVHWLLCAAGFGLIPLWPGPGGVVLCILYIALGNLPFIIIQRYNRPRFRRLLKAAQARERRRADAGFDTVEQ